MVETVTGAMWGLKSTRERLRLARVVPLAQMSLQESNAPPQRVHIVGCERTREFSVALVYHEGSIGHG